MGRLGWGGWSGVRRGSSWGRRGWNWVRRVLSQGIGVGEVKGVGGLGSKGLELGSEEFGSRGRVGIKEVGGVGFGRLGLGKLGLGVGYDRLGLGELGLGGWGQGLD